MTKSRFPKQAAEDLLVKSGRRCSLCEQEKGGKVEVHHIIPAGDGGPATIENGIVLCFDCHAEVHAYWKGNPKGRQFSVKELCRRRDAWFEKFSQRIPEVDYKRLARELLEQLNTNAPPPRGSMPLDVEQLAAQATGRTVQLLDKALAHMARDENRQAIECILTAYDMDMPAHAKVQLHLLAGDGYAQLGEFREAESHYQRAFELARSNSLRKDEGLSLFNLGIVHLHRGNLELSRSLTLDAVTIAQQTGYKLLLAAGHAQLGRIATDLGRLDEAEDETFKALRMHRQDGDHLGQAVALGNLGFIRAHRGDFKGALDYHKKALKASRASGATRSVAEDIANIGWAYVHLEKRSRGARYLQDALEMEERIGNKHGQGITLGMLGNCAMMEGNRALAGRHYEQSIGLLREAGDRLQLANQMGNLGNVRLSEGKIGESRELYEQAIAIHKEINYPLGYADGLRSLGFLAIRSEDRDEACRLLTEASEIYARIGVAGAGQDMVRAKLRELGCDEKEPDPIQNGR